MSNMKNQVLYIIYMGYIKINFVIRNKRYTTLYTLLIYIYYNGNVKEIYNIHLYSNIIYKQNYNTHIYICTQHTVTQ